MNHIVLAVIARAIFGHTPTSDSFWTEISLTFQTSTDSGRFLSETGSTSQYNSQTTGGDYVQCPTVEMVITKVRYIFRLPAVFLRIVE